MTDTVLVVDGPFEVGTDLVMERLSSSDIPVFRMDTADFPHGLELRATNVDAQWVGTLSNQYRTVALANVKAVYWNRPICSGSPGCRSRTPTGHVAPPVSAPEAYS
ncbi:MvdC/MvdD family ATP grasp protein [Streptomyces cucumeris]|uniref:MvdC/MvdD family ATP grasp protein n=1 Tax=Streptomyces cucumeris TaxID=2962890 RepID=UPI003D744135